jgi:SAM-dependent methyltransferase
MLMGKANDTARAAPATIRMGTLTGLWTAAQRLRTLRAATAPPEPAPSVDPGDEAGAAPPSAGETAPPSASHPLASSDPALWGAYDLRILDLRRGPVYQRQHIPEAASIPAAEIPTRIHELPPKWRELILVSDQAREARQIADLLRQRGWLRAVALTESVEGWPGPWAAGPPERVLWEPTPVVRRWAPSMQLGRVLDLGCGSGRDAVYLAQRGHEVIAVDLLPDALAMADGLAHRMGVTIACRQMDLRKQRPPADDGFDAILMVRFLERSLFPWMAAALRPGGLLMLEGFAQGPLQGDRPRAPRWKLGPQEALRAFAEDPALQIQEYLEMPDPAGTMVVRLVGRSTRRANRPGVD